MGGLLKTLSVSDGFPSALAFSSGERRRQETPKPNRPQSAGFGETQKRKPSITGEERQTGREIRLNTITNFKAHALSPATLKQSAPSVFAEGPAPGLSRRYTFVPTSEIVEGLQEAHWMPVQVEEQRARQAERIGFQKHVIRFRQLEQMATLDEWNVELVLLNSHDAGCAYQIHAGIYRRICSNGLVVSEGGFETLRFRHSGLNTVEVVKASLRVIESVPQISQRIHDFRTRSLTFGEQLNFARAALQVRYEDSPPVNPDALLRPRRVEDNSDDLWTIFNRVQENLIRGGVCDGHRGRNGRLRSVRALRGIDSKVTINKALWGLAEQVIRGYEPTPEVTLSV